MRAETMPRIPYPDPQTLPEWMQKIVSDNPANVTRMLAGASEAVFKGFAALSSAFTLGGSLAIYPTHRMRCSSMKRPHAMSG